MDQLVEDLRESYIRLSNIPTILYGHIMGAHIAYALMVKLHEIGEQLPFLFFAATSPAPAKKLCKNPRHLFNDDELITEHSKIPGSNANLLTNRDIREITMPALGSDFELLDTYVNHFPYCLPTSVCAVAVTRDLVTEAKWFHGIIYSLKPSVQNGLTTIIFLLTSYQ
ncbi:thioesterase II family protein [Teredinibacter turnerae]|uniref:thioesterase II family protein n=1 Tax=Teredinibacter turnerae TaxID=2426 RepID=UPI0012FC8A2C|nr:thioesterase domain-containing protein [Teredinibacter turnerae]